MFPHRNSGLALPIGWGWVPPEEFQKVAIDDVQLLQRRHVRSIGYDVHLGAGDV